jgi:hypothetical protein
MKSKLEGSMGWSVLFGLLILAVILFLAAIAQDNITSGKQCTFDRARANLLTALSDSDLSSSTETKQFGYFMVHHAISNEVVVDGKSYSLAFFTEAEYQFAHQGRLAITTNRQFIWLDNRHGAKLISDGYKVPRWYSGF